MLGNINPVLLRLNFNIINGSWVHKHGNTSLTGRYFSFSNFQLVHPKPKMSQELIQASLIPHSHLRRGTSPQDLLGGTWRGNNPIEQPSPQAWCGHQQSLPCLGEPQEKVQFTLKRYFFYCHTVKNYMVKYLICYVVVSVVDCVVLVRFNFLQYRKVP